MKKLNVFFILFLFSMALPQFIVCDGLDVNFDTVSSDFDNDVLLNDLFKLVDLDSIEKQNKKLEEANRSKLNPLNLDEINLWRKTEGFRTRDPLFLIPQRRLAVDKPGLFCHAFYNMSNTLPVRPNLVLSTKAVDMLIELTKPGGILVGVDLTDLDQLLRILPFVDKMTIQERKIGGMFQANIVDGRWVLQLDTLLMLVERNFWAQTKSDRKALFDMLGDSEKKDSYRMRFGLGDTRVRLGYKVSDFDVVKAILGVSVILPTSRIGRKKPHGVVTTKVGDLRSKLIDDLLNMNRQLMIEPKLGTGHWGLGLFLDTRINLIQNKLDFWSRISFDYLFSGNEYRYMPSTRPISFKTLSELTVSDTVPADFPINDLFPCLAQGRVSPGNIFNATFGFDWKITNNWNFGFGYDFYSQQEEKISRVTAPNVDTSLLSIEDSIASEITQHKLFGHIYYTKKGEATDWHFGIGGDLTFSSNGGPRDWTIFANIGITF